MGSIICVLLKIYFFFQQWQNFENPLRIEKVITTSQVYYLFGTQSSLKFENRDFSYTTCIRCPVDGQPSEFRHKVSRKNYDGWYRYEKVKKVLGYLNRFYTIHKRDRHSDRRKLHHGIYRPCLHNIARQKQETHQQMRQANVTA